MPYTVAQERTITHPPHAILYVHPFAGTPVSRRMTRVDQEIQRQASTTGPATDQGRARAQARKGEASDEKYWRDQRSGISPHRYARRQVVDSLSGAHDDLRLGWGDPGQPAGKLGEELTQFGRSRSPKGPDLLERRHAQDSTGEWCATTRALPCVVHTRGRLRVQ
ncbi:unnamed protein product [Ectocarpus sp. 8 AP-2014]